MPQVRYKGNSRQDWYIDAISAAKCFSTLPSFTFRFGVSSPSVMLKGFSMPLEKLFREGFRLLQLRFAGFALYIEKLFFHRDAGFL